MPKKRSFNFKTIQGSSSNSKPNGGGGGANGDQPKQTVNERLSELRKVEGKDAAQKKRELAEAVSQRSVPPNLQSVLGQSASVPPKPKRGIRSRMAIPGPAPPKSWQKPSWTPLSLAMRGGRSFKKGRSTDDNRSRPIELYRFARMVGDETIETDTSSLLHLALKTTAEHWTLFDADDLPAWAEVPLRLRLRLLSYLGFYGPTIDVKALEALTTGTEAVKGLDLAGLAGHGSLTLRRLVKFLKDSASQAVNVSEPEAIAESWDADATFEAVLISQPSTSKFVQLTHLSLSHPPPSTSSWRDLLALSKQVPGLTHLSLAYWARPTFTPNLTTATVSSQHSPDVSAGGSDYYSGIDNDFSEPATILRQLSCNLLQLQWLDLEGCTDWVPALAYRGGERVWDFPTDGGIRESWMSRPVVLNIFAQNWKNLAYLNCAQGWSPSVEGLCSLPRQALSLEDRQLAKDYVTSVGAVDLWKSGGDWEKDLYHVERRKANIWLQREREAWITQRRINETRRQNACKPVTIDHGWERKTF